MSFRYIVVEDASFVTELIKNILAETGARFVGDAPNGVEGFHLFEKTRPDLVILDIVMPKENGIELVRRIREVAALDVVVIACSTLDDKNIIDNARDAGCDDYLKKPFTKQELLQMIKKHFNVEREIVK